MKYLMAAVAFLTVTASHGMTSVNAQVRENGWFEVNRPQWFYKLNGVGDVSGDGIADLVYEIDLNKPDYPVNGEPRGFTQGQIYYLYQNVETSLSRLVPIEGLTTQGGWTVEAIGDVDGNGTDDILMQNSAGIIRVATIENAEVIRDYSFQPLSSYQRLLGVGDINDDGMVEWAFEHGDGGVQFTDWSGNPVLTRDSVPPGNTIVAVGDVNSDGEPDVLLTTDTGNNTYLLNVWPIKDGQWQNAYYIRDDVTGAYMKPIGIGDLNGDTFNDIALYVEAQSNRQVWALGLKIDRPLTLFPETYTTPVSIPPLENFIRTGQVGTGYVEFIHVRPIIAEFKVTWTEVLPDGGTIRHEWYSGDQAVGYQRAVFMKNARDIRVTARELVTDSRVMNETYATPPNLCLQLNFSDYGPCTSDNLARRYGDIAGTIETLSPFIDAAMEHIAEYGLPTSVDGKTTSELSDTYHINELAAKIRMIERDVSLQEIGFHQSANELSFPPLMRPVFTPGESSLKEDAALLRKRDGSIRSITFGSGFDAAVILGASVGGGVAMSTEGLPSRGFYYLAWSVGASLGAEAPLSLGLFLDSPADLSGNSYGVSLGASYVAGFNLTLWYSYKEDKFLGLEIGPAVGMDVNLEYVRGHTCVDGTDCPNIWD